MAGKYRCYKCKKYMSVKHDYKNKILYLKCVCGVKQTHPYIDLEEFEEARKRLKERVEKLDTINALNQEASTERR